ncbi:fatty acyl-AMP ligase [Streptomyces fildesensis]|uniref:Fatty acyl-AMP ligase n=1 Tax=Streptomyces fildesensis TaxID=375757 RepID=A0ABW8C3C7_9ACTN
MTALVPPSDEVSDAPGPLITDQLVHWAHRTPGEDAFTFVDHTSEHPLGRRRTLTWSRLYEQVRAVAAAIDRSDAASRPVALLAPQGLPYIVGFLACLHAGAIAVPLFPPDLLGHGDRLRSVVDDCRPDLVLTTIASRQQVEEFFAQRGGPSPQILAIDGIKNRNEEWVPRHVPEPQDLAYLQYTSGSTGTPAGVMITHRNIMSNARQAMAAYQVQDGPRVAVGWLPLFHDMGLVLSVAAPVVAGIPSLLMDPVSFLVQPARWLWLLGERPGAVSAAPNFAYEYCVQRLTPEVKRSLHLGQVKALINGSEPVRAEALDRFAEAFAECGLRREVLCPSYGLAEATVLVTADSPARHHRTIYVDRVALMSNHVVVSLAPDALRLAVCGRPVEQRVRISDPESGTECAPGIIGEIRVQGPNIGQGYWGKADLSAAVFDAAMPDAPMPDTEDDRDAPWLRTGDLGFLDDGELVITGRIKDLIVVDGRNHYPQDLEASVSGAHVALRPDRVAAFTVEEGQGEAVVIVAERGRSARSAGPEAIEQAVRAALSTRHGLPLGVLRIVPPGRIPRTSSGKISRRACRTLYLADGFPGITQSAATA